MQRSKSTSSSRVCRGGLPRLFSQSAILYCSFILQTPATLKNMDTPGSPTLSRSK